MQANSLHLWSCLHISHLPSTIAINTSSWLTSDSDTLPLRNKFSDIITLFNNTLILFTRAHASQVVCLRPHFACSSLKPNQARHFASTWIRNKSRQNLDSFLRNQQAQKVNYSASCNDNDDDDDVDVDEEEERRLWGLGWRQEDGSDGRLWWNIFIRYTCCYHGVQILSWSIWEGK